MPPGCRVMREEFLYEALAEEENAKDRPNQKVQRVISQVAFERTFHQRGSLPQKSPVRAQS